MKCEKCGRNLGPGSGAYILTMTFVADAEYNMPDETGDPGDAALRLIEEAALLSEDELEAQVYLKKIFTLCRLCKEALAADPLGTGRAGAGSVQ